MNEKFLNLLIKWNNGLKRGAQVKLAKNLAIKESIVSKWVSGAQVPGEANLHKMAALFGVPVSALYKVFNRKPFVVKEVTPANVSNVVEGRIELEYVPVRGMSSATEEKFILEETETFLPFRKTGPNQFAIKIVGNCMVDPDDPRNSIYDGDYVIVDPDAEARDGDVIVARLDGEYSTVKRMYKHDAEVHLVPDNPAHKPIIRTGATFIVGKVIDVYRPVRAKKERKI